jgi:hypothetical protein
MKLPQLPRDDTGPKFRPPVTDQYRTERLRKGLCDNCRVVQCYEIKRRIAGLFPVKVPLTIIGKVYNGICLDCYPDRDPDRSEPGSIATMRQSNAQRNTIVEDAVNGDNFITQVHHHNSNEEKIEEQPANVTDYESTQPTSSRRETEGHINTLSNEEKVEEQADEDVSYDIPYPPLNNRGMEGNSRMRDSSAQSNSSLDTDEPLDALTKLLKGYLDQNPEESLKFDPDSENAEIHVQEAVMDDQSVLTMGSGLETIATRQKSQRTNLMPISESTSIEPSVAPHVAASPAQVTNLREIVEQCTGAGLDDNAIEIIRGELIRDNDKSKNIDLALYCLNTLWSLARKSDDNKREIINGNTPSTFDAILEAMSIYVKSAELLARGCGLLSSLSMEPNNRTHVAKSGGCDAILEAMNFHQDVESLQAMAIRALRVLSFDTFGRNVLCSWGAPMSVADAMHMHINNPSIQSEGSIILGKLAVDEESQTIVHVSEREIDAIIRGMLEHPDSLAVHEAA